MHSGFTRGDDYRRAQLLYGGRSGDVLTSVYQLTVGNDATPTISRVHQVDLRQGSRFSIEGLDIRVLQAETNSMRYRIIGPTPRP
jgi:hypothetical protein